MIHDLPVEILSHIFTIGCQAYPSLETEQTPWGPKPLERVKNFTKSVPRRRKALAAKVSEVCSRWRDIVDISSNSHFWIAHLFLASGDYVPGPTSRRPEAFTTQFATYKHILDTSKGCDLSFHWLISWKTEFVDPFSRYDISQQHLIEVRDTVRLVMHSVQLAAQYQRQWQSVWMRTFQPELVGLLITFLNRPVSCPSLIWVQINDSLDDFDGPISHNHESGISLEGTERNYELHTGLHDYSSWTPPSTLNALYHLALCRLTLPNPFLVPPALHSLTVIGQSPFDAWSEFRAFAASNSTLHSLEIDFPKAAEKSSNLDYVVFGRLKRLSISGSHVSILHSVLLLLASTSLESLDLRVNGLVNDGPDMRIPDRNIVIPSVRHITVSYFTFHELQLLSTITMPDVLSYSINMWNPEHTSEHYHTFDWPDLQSLRYKSPPNLQIKFIPSRMIAVYVSILDYSSLTELFLEFSRHGNPATIPSLKGEPFEPGRIALPNLQKLYLHSEGLNASQHELLECFDFPKLWYLELQPKYEGSLLEYGGLWTILLEKHSKVLTRLKEAVIYLPPWDEEAKNPLSVFENVERLTLSFEGHKKSVIKWVNEAAKEASILPKIVSLIMRVLNPTLRSWQADLSPEPDLLPSQEWADWIVKQRLACGGSNWVAVLTKVDDPKRTT